MEKKRKYEVYKKESIHYMPKPMNIHNYCGICNKTFEEYYAHIASDKHRSRVKQDKNMQYIQELMEDPVESSRKAE